MGRKQTGQKTMRKFTATSQHQYTSSPWKLGRKLRWPSHYASVYFTFMCVLSPIIYVRRFYVTHLGYLWCLDQWHYKALCWEKLVRFSCLVLCVRNRIMVLCPNLYLLLPQDIEKQSKVKVLSGSMYMCKSEVHIPAQLIQNMCCFVPAFHQPTHRHQIPLEYTHIENIILYF